MTIDQDKNRARILRVYDSTLAKVESFIANPNSVELHVPEVWIDEKLEKYVNQGLISSENRKYLRLRIAVAMQLQEFVGLNPNGSWPVSFNEEVNGLFNAKSLKESLQLLQIVSASDLILQTRDCLNDLLSKSSSGETNEEWRQMASRISDPIYANNSINTKTLLHFFFVYLISRIQSGDLWKARDLLSGRVADLDRHLRAYVQCSPIFASNVWRGLSQAPNSEATKFGQVYFYYGQSASDLPESERLYGFFGDVADELKGELANDFAERHFLEFGLIPSDDCQLPELEFAQSQPRPRLVSVPIEVPRLPSQDRLREFLPTFKYTGTFSADYSEYWQLMSDENQGEAEKFIADIAERFFYPDNDSRRTRPVDFNSLNSSKGKVDKGEEKNLAKLLEFTSDRMINYLIGRRIMLRLSHSRTEREYLAKSLGFLAREDGSSIKGGKAFSSHQERCGLNMDDCRDPFRVKSSVHNVVGELEWLKKFRS